MSLHRTPFYEHHVSAGARMVPFAGWEMPVQYAGLIAEHTAVRTAVGLFDVSHMGEVRVTGPRAQEAVDRLVSNDVMRLGDGEALYTVMCNQDGGVVDDLIVYRLAENEMFICINAANRQKDFDWMVAHNACGDEAVFHHESDDWAQIAIQGRHAQALLAELTDADLDGIAYYAIGHGLTVAGVEGCMIARTGYTGEDGFEVFLPPTGADALWKAVHEAGEKYGLADVGLGARDTLRLEARYCLYGHELDDQTSPWQAGLGWVTKMDKTHDFVGKEALASRKGNEARRLVGLVIEGKRIARDGMDVQDTEGNVIGTVTSGTRSPSLGAGIALAYVDRAFFKPGTRVVIDVRGKQAPAVVHKGPFFSRDY